MVHVKTYILLKTQSENDDDSDLFYTCVSNVIFQWSCHD